MSRSSKPAAAAGPAAGDTARLLHDRRSAAAAKYAEQGQYNGTVSVRPSVCLSQHGPQLLRARRQEISLDCCTVGAQRQRLRACGTQIDR